MNLVEIRLNPVAFVLVAFLGLLSIQYLFGFYQERHQGIAKLGRSTVAKWDFAVSELGEFSYWSLILFSVAGMFFEMMMIRWVSSEIRIFAYFKNFVLVACFFGFGLGCYFSKRRVNLIALFLPLLLMCLLIEVPWAPLRTLITILPGLLGSSAEVHIWGMPSMPTNWRMTISAILITVPIFGLLVFCFVPFGQLVGWMLENAGEGIRAYSVNVIAGLAGIALFTGLCFANTPPVVWLVVFAVLMVAGLWKVPRLRWTAVALSAVCLGLLAIPPPDLSTTTYWSPYQKLSMRPIYDAGEIISYEVSTNDTWYQRIVNLSPEFLKRHPDLLSGQAVEWDPYNLPYRFSPSPGSVLVQVFLQTGAGTYGLLGSVPLAVTDSRPAAGVGVASAITPVAFPVRPHRPARTPVLGAE